MDKLAQMMRLLASGPHTCKALALSAGVSMDTAYRWAHTLERAGFVAMQRQRSKGRGAPVMVFTWKAEA